ncbi:TetR/AcrR family transcriptional regulator [Phenylobacterium montanum]|uniref:TetR/AcrR family transcriptional regulator n=1 Tax=Phenylobacterium montanum TaxID=2823693 RepID=A0A975FXM8_9CAUL|nr:TetR/AcrR family transcriptional regulator [Caulobacter sp. S6]QUD87358.1 TetR/AcrR family transcriptional regulator [Caulobacter sp. S6]
MSEFELLDSPTAPLAAGKRELTKQQNRRAILDAAREVFGEMGYETATVRDIIRRTGLSVGSFYNYYRSKEEVYEALADDGARRFRPILQAQYEAAADFQSYIRGAITAYFNFILEEHETWGVVRPPGDGVPHVHTHSQTPEMKAVFEQVKSSISAALERDRSAPVDADYLAAACIAIAEEVGHKMLERRPVDVPAAIEFAVAMILGGLPALPRLKA